MRATFDTVTGSPSRRAPAPGRTRDRVRGRRRCRECSPAASRGRETDAVARRWILTVVVAAVLVVGAVIAAHAIRDDDTGRPDRAATATTREPSTTAAP